MDGQFVPSGFGEISHCVVDSFQSINLYREKTEAYRYQVINHIINGRSTETLRSLGGHLPRQTKIQLKLPLLEYHQSGRKNCKVKLKDSVKD